jgi:hypothetical protein
MTVAIFTLLLLLQLKHWLVDFVLQTNDEVIDKGIYGSPIGIGHSIKQGLGTLLCIVAVTGVDYLFYAVVLATTDFILHYHIDWTKSNYGNNDITSKAFWVDLGLDQMAHQMTYLFIAWMVA